MGKHHHNLSPRSRSRDK